jgi:molybdate transport system ATP-binding protein
MTLDLALTARRGDFALDLQAEVQAGPCIALWGPSGAGKSTTLALLAGLDRPDAGHIRLAGTTLFDRARRIEVPARKRRLGVVFQDARLFPHLNVRANLLFGARRHREGPSQEGPNREGQGAAPDFDHVVDLMGLAGLLARRPRDLSGGERQRVALARALLSRPRALLLDEPFAALDRPRKAEILGLVDRIKAETGLPIILVSHDLDEVLRLADAMIALDQGRVAAAGAVADLFADGRLRRLIGGDAFGSVIDASVAEQHRAEGLTGYRWAGGLIWGRAVDLPVGQALRLRVRARDVAIALDPPGPTSIRNVLPATVAHIDRAGQHGEPLVHLAIGAGAGLGRLLAAVSSGAIDALGLAPGQSVVALIKALAIEPTGGTP